MVDTSIVPLTYKGSVLICKNESSEGGTNGDTRDLYVYFYLSSVVLIDTKLKDFSFSFMIGTTPLLSVSLSFHINSHLSTSVRGTLV